jgi:hypothetical protein
VPGKETQFLLAVYGAIIDLGTAGINTTNSE